MLLTMVAMVCAGAGANASAQSPDNVAVVINESHEGSREVGEYYVNRRRIPASNVITIKTTTEEVIDRPAYVTTIEEPIVAALARAQSQDRILYLVLTKGVPLRIGGTGGIDGTTASVDSELTLLYRKMLGQSVLVRGRVDNPYFLGSRDVREAKPFSHREYDIFLVSRLDGFTSADARSLVDRAAAAVSEGTIVLDQRATAGSRIGDEWLAAAAKRLSAAGNGDDVVLETTTVKAQPEGLVLGRYSWGSSDPQNRARRSGIRFAPGAIAASFVNSDARTFVEPPSDWVPSGDFNRDKVFKGTTHSLIGDLIRDGVTGVAGHVSEPYLQSVIRPDILFSAYRAGHNLIESFYLAMPHLGWQAVVVGDPLCAAIAREAPDPSVLDAPVDPATGLPGFFSNRRLALVMKSSPDLPRGAAIAWVRATALIASDDLAGATRAFEQAIDAAPTNSPLRLQLALLLHRRKETGAAIEQYKRLLGLQPNHVVALNNLAYLLAVDGQTPAEALPLANRAVVLSPSNADAHDTLGWVEHLLGDHDSAAKRLAAAVAIDPNRADIRVHAAVIHAARGAWVSADAQLKEALRIDPSLEQTEAVQQLRKKLATKAP